MRDLPNVPYDAGSCPNASPAGSTAGLASCFDRVNMLPCSAPRPCHPPVVAHCSDDAGGVGPVTVRVVDVCVLGRAWGRGRLVKVLQGGGVEARCSGWWAG